MRRLYVVPHDVWLQHVEHFHHTKGSHYINLEGGMILVAADFANENGEEIWESHEHVAALPHPTFEGKVSLKDHAADPFKRFGKKHLDHLSEIGVLPGDSVMHVSAKARAIHPLVRIGNLL